MPQISTETREMNSCTFSDIICYETNDKNKIEHAPQYKLEKNQY